MFLRENRENLAPQKYSVLQYIRGHIGYDFQKILYFFLSRSILP